jgi:biotin transporter BioY
MLICYYYYYYSFQGTISLNAGIFASLLLASRLGSNLAVFAFLLFAFEVFAGFPILAHHIRVCYFMCHSLVFVYDHHYVSSKCLYLHV